MPDKPESFLVADCGSVSTKVGLVDLIGGGHRFVALGTAATTAEPPVGDVLAGVRRAAEQIQSRIGRRLFGEDGQLVIPERAGGQGVDGFCTAVSAPPPLRVAIVGLSRAVSLLSALKAVRTTYATVQVTLALDEAGSRWVGARAEGDHGGEHRSADMPEKDPAVIAAEKLARADLDVIVLVGGIDGGATTALYDIANLVAVIAASREENDRPCVIFAGNCEARPKIVERIGQVTALRVVDNVHPSLDRENPGPLQHELEMLYEERRLAHLPGLGRLNAWTEAPVIPSARAFENVVRFLSRRYNLNVLGADVGGTTTTLVTAHAEAHARTVRADLGTGHSLDNLIAQAGVEGLTQWLPLEGSADDLLADYFNRSLHPAMIPTTREDMLLVQASARAAIAIAAREASLDTAGVDLVLLTGAALSHGTQWGALALAALDALQPQGTLTLAVDALGLAPAFGALAAVNAEAAASVIERDGFVTLGTVIAPTSTNHEGQIDLTVQVQPAGGGAINLEVEHGSIEVVPLAPGQKASLEVHTLGGAALSVAPGGVYKAEVEGGVVGLIIDARGRPITLPTDAEKRKAQVQEWLWEAGG